MFARLKSFSTLRPYVAENRRLLLLGAVTLVLANYLDVKVLVLLGKGVDLIGWNLGPFAGIHAQLLTVFLLLLGALAIAAAVARFWMRWLIIGASRQIEFKYRDDLFRHLEGLSASFFSRYSTGDIMSRSTNDLESVRLVIGPAVMYISGTMVMLPMSLYQMIQISGWLTFCTWAPLVLVAPLFYFFNHRIHARFTRAQEIFSDISTRVQETLTGIRVIKVYAREEQEAKRFGELSLRYVDENVRLALLQAYFIPLMGFIISLSMLALIWVGGVMIVHQTAEAAGITLGSLIALFVLLMANIWPLAAIGWVFSMVERGSASMERLNKLFDEKSEIVDSPAGIELLKSAAEGNGAAQGTPAALRLRGELECRNLTFTYPGAANPSLRDINFRLGAGQILGLTGPVGCGKSTLAALLARRFNPQATSLLVDGRDILDWPLREYRRQVSIVDQEPFLFSDTIAANICYGLP
ncbi:ATP-binding cassette domain-containing protein, partial [Candidatus Sumerlaeota bacterium]|nr:ATP-binding cassette domain-containing protein [Candidatus Sumerlaeota bacterium]